MGYPPLGVACGYPPLALPAASPPRAVPAPAPLWVMGYLQMARFRHDRGPAGQGRVRWPLASGGTPISQLNYAGRAEAGSQPTRGPIETNSNSSAHALA